MQALGESGGTSCAVARTASGGTDSVVCVTGFLPYFFSTSGTNSFFFFFSFSVEKVEVPQNLFFQQNLLLDCVSA